MDPSTVYWICIFFTPCLVVSQSNWNSTWATPVVSTLNWAPCVVCGAERLQPLQGLGARLLSDWPRMRHSLAVPVELPVLLLMSVLVCEPEAWIVVPFSRQAYGLSMPSETADAVTVFPEVNRSAAGATSSPGALLYKGLLKT